MCHVFTYADSFCILINDMTFTNKDVTLGGKWDSGT